MRGYARETAFCKVFSFLLSGNVDDDFSQFDESKLTDEDKAFAMKLVQGVVDNKQTLDAVVSEYSKAFKINRIYRPDLAALEIAVYEMQFTEPNRNQRGGGHCQEVLYGKEHAICQRNTCFLRKEFCQWLRC